MNARTLIDHRYTRHPVARGSRPDARVRGIWYLIKKTSVLRLTYQIRMLTLAVAQEGARLVIQVPKECRLLLGSALGGPAP